MAIRKINHSRRILSKKRTSVPAATRAELKLDYEQAYERLIAGDDSPSTRIVPSPSYYS